MALTEEQLYALGDTTLTSDKQARGAEVQTWIRPLGRNEALPPEITITTEAEAVLGATTISLSASVACSVFKKSQIWVGGTLLVITEDNVIGTSATDIAVLPLKAGVALSATGLYYEMFPVLSLKDGGTFTANDAGVAESNNKAQGLYITRDTVTRSGGIEFNGSYFINDRAYNMLVNASNYKNQKVYVEIRNNSNLVFEDEDGNDLTDGEGLNTVKGRFVVTKAFPSGDPKDEFISATASLQTDGVYSPYKVLGKAA